MTELEKILQPLMEIADDETFCDEEYNTIKEYIEEKDFINVSNYYKNMIYTTFKFYFCFII